MIYFFYFLFFHFHRIQYLWKNKCQGNLIQYAIDKKIGKASYKFFTTAWFLVVATISIIKMGNKVKGIVKQNTEPAK